MNDPSPTEVSEVPCPRVAPCGTTTSSATPLPAKSDAVLPVAEDSDVVMHDTTPTSLELQNDNESSVKGCTTDSAASIPGEKVDDDVVMQATTSTSSQLRDDAELPVWLSQMIGYLRGVSDDVAWQELVTEFVDFERRGPPNGVSFLGLHHIEAI